MNMERQQYLVESALFALRGRNITLYTDSIRTGDDRRNSDRYKDEAEEIKVLITALRNGTVKLVQV